MGDNTSTVRDDVWVEVETNKESGSISSYRGRIQRAALERWFRGDRKGAILVEDVYWTVDDPDEEGGVQYVIPGHTPGPYRNGLGKFYVRADTIVVISLLRDGTERDEALSDQFIGQGYSA